MSVVSATASPQTLVVTPRRETLLNGLNVLMFNDLKADKVAVKIRVHAGSAFDPQGKEGVMQLLADNVFPSETVREFFAEDLGGSLDVTTNYDYIQIDASSSPENVLSMLETLSTAISNPTIDKETTAKLKTALTARIKNLEADPNYVADQAASKRLFGSFPYGRPQYGTEDSVKRIDFADLIDAKQRFLTADNATIAISGNFDRSLVFKAIRRYFGGWLKSDKRVPSTFRQPDDPPAALLTLPSPNVDVAAIRFAARSVARSDRNLAAANLFTAIVEERLKSRVPSAFADKVFARNEAHVLPGWIVIGFSAGKNDIGSGNGKVAATELLTKVLADAITDVEYYRARTTASAEWAKRGAELFWLDYDTYGTASADADRRIYDTVTLADVRSFAEKLKSSPMVSVLVNTPQ
jgi:zinc protease